MFWLYSLGIFWWRDKCPWFYPRCRSARWNLHCAHEWFFRTNDRLAPAKTRKDVLHYRQNRQEECTGIASLIPFASSDIFKPDLGTTSVKGCVHVDEHIRLSSLKRRLLMNHANFPYFPKIAFNVILPERKQHKERFTNIPLFWNSKITRMQLVLPVNGFGLFFAVPSLGFQLGISTWKSWVGNGFALNECEIAIANPQGHFCGNLDSPCTQKYLNIRKLRSIKGWLMGSSRSTCEKCLNRLLETTRPSVEGPSWTNV